LTRNRTGFYFSGSQRAILEPLLSNIRNNFTYEFWIKPDGKHNIVRESTSGIHGIKGQKFLIAPGKSSSSTAGIGISVGSNGISVFEHAPRHFPALLVYDGTIIDWVHLALVVRDKTPYLYLNGQLVKKGLKSSMNEVVASGVFGAHDCYGGYRGSLSELRLWNYAREDHQIAEGWNRELTIPNYGLVGYWSIEGAMFVDRINKQQHIPITALDPYFSCDVNLIIEQLVKPVTVIVPIYNAYDDLVKCVHSILEHTRVPYRLLLVNDGSTDPRITNFLDGLQDLTPVTVVHQENNRGYVESINDAIMLCKGDIVLLNSDTIVSERWLLKLKVAAYQEREIGTVTPFSNAAGAFSVPVFGGNQPPPQHLGLLGTAKLIEQHSFRLYPSVPTGNGFCFYIKREVLEDIGLFDSINFPRGYGEENDFCMRAGKRGWRHIIDDSTYIYHKRSASFGQEKNTLVEKNGKRLLELYPEYNELTRQFIHSPVIKWIRQQIASHLINPSTETDHLKKNVLYVHEDRPDLSFNTGRFFMQSMSPDEKGLLLQLSREHANLYHYAQGQISLLRTWDLGTLRSKELKNIIFQVLILYGIEMVHIPNHLIPSIGSDILLLAQSCGIPVQRNSKL
jgi:GT2 family glycosyltransferase